MKKLALFGMAVALTSAAVAGQALAGDQEVIVTGKTTGGYFDGTLIGVGVSYQEVFEVDVADLTESTIGGSYYDQSSSSVSPVQSVALTIDGKTESFTPTSSAVLFESGAPTAWTIGASAPGDSASFDVGSTKPFADPFHNTVVLNIGGPVFAIPGYYTQFTVGTTTDVGLTPASVFPEPSMWALMIGGVALAGLLLRRKPETTSPAAPVLG